MISKLMLEFRSQNGLTQESLGALLNVTGNYISKIERDIVVPSYKLVCRFFEIIVSEEYEISFEKVEKESIVFTLTWLINKLPQQKTVYITESILNIIKAVQDSSLEE